MSMLKQLLLLQLLKYLNLFDPNKFGCQRKINRFVVQGNERKKRVMWIIDSGCSSHMTGDRALLSNLVKKAVPWVTFGDDIKGFTK